MKITNIINKEYIYNVGLFISYLYIFYMIFDISHHLHLINKHMASIDVDINYMFNHIITDVE